MSHAVSALLALVLAVGQDVAEFDFAPPAAPPIGPPATRIEMDAAKGFLAENAASKDSPRVAFDVLMAAAVAGDKATADDMRMRLIFDYSGSVQQRFLLTTLDAEGYRELLSAAARQKELTPDSAAKFCHAVEVGYGTWKAAFLNDDAFLLECGLAATVAHDKQLIEYCRTSLIQKRPSENEARVKIRTAAEILFDASLSNDEKCLALHRIEGNDTARRLAEHFDSRLTGEQRQRADLVEARVERLMENHDFAAALPLIETLLQQDGETPKRLFLRAWCEASTGDSSSVEHFRDIEARFPNDPWTATAQQSADAVAALEENIDEQAEAVAESVRKAFRDEIQLVEATGQWRRASGPISVYAAMNFADYDGEAVLNAGPTCLAAVRSDGERVRLFLDGDPAINVFRNTGSLNIPQPKITFDPVERRFGFAASFSTKSTPADGSEATAATIALMRNLQPAMVRPMLEGRLGQGWLPIAAKRDESGTTFGWIVLSPRRPEVETWSVRITNDQHLATVEGPSFSLQHLRYGPAGSFELSPPAWPALPVVEHETFDPAVMFRAMGTLTRLWSDEKTAPPSATADANDAAPR